MWLNPKLDLQAIIVWGRGLTNSYKNRKSDQNSNVMMLSSNSGLKLTTNAVYSSAEM